MMRKNRHLSKAFKLRYSKTLNVHSISQHIYNFSKKFLEFAVKSYVDIYGSINFSKCLLNANLSKK